MSIIQPDDILARTAALCQRCDGAQPNITFYAACDKYVGVDLRQRTYGILRKAPSPVNVTATVGDSSIATVSTNMDTAGMEQLR